MLSGHLIALSASYQLLYLCAQLHYLDHGGRIQAQHFITPRAEGLHELQGLGDALVVDAGARLA